MKPITTNPRNQHRSGAIRAGFLVAAACTLIAPGALFGKCGPDLDNQIRTHLGQQTMNQAAGFMTQTITMVNNGPAVKGSIYFGIYNLPANVDVTPMPYNATIAFTSVCELGVKYLRVYLGPQNDWAAGATKTLQVGFPVALQPFTYSFKVIKGTNMANFSATRGDYDGDHTADLAMFNPRSATWTIKFSTSNLISSTVFGAPGDKFVVGDFDGDLKDDLATYQPSTHKWSIRYSSDGTVHTLIFGTPQAIPVPADYDGDGYTDIAFYDPPTHQFVVLQSSNQQFAVQQWGQAGDIPVPADYDEDGKADFAVFSPAIKTFHILYSKTKQAFSYGSNDFNGYPFGIFVTQPKAEPATYDPATGMVTIHVIGPNTVYHIQAGSNAIPVVADFTGDFVMDFGTFSRPTAAWALDSQFFNPNLHPILSFTFGTPGADLPVSAVPSSLY